MGFSVTIASAIVLIGLVIFFGSLSAVLVYSLNTLFDTTKEYVNREREKFDVRLELNITSIGADTCTIKLRNLGTKTIFLQSQENFQWNSIVISYQNNSQWLSYIIENYTVLDVRVIDTQVLFNPADHPFINPGEEATISFNLPEEAPTISQGTTVIVVFASHYGATAQTEGVR